MDISELKWKRDARPLRRHPWEVARAQVIIRLLRRASRSLPAGHIVDIGSGDGYIAEILVSKGLGIRYSAVDPAFEPEMMAGLETKMPAITCFRNIKEIPREAPAADIILLLDVLEHLADPSALIAETKTLPDLPTTKWIITVPAFGSVFSSHDRVLGHYRRYTARQLTELCTANGLQIEEEGYFFFSLLTIRWLHKWNPLPGRDPGNTVQNWRGGRLPTSFLSSLLTADYRLSAMIRSAGVRLPGLSCYCICRRA